MMKEITAIIRMNKMNATKRALAAVGIGSMTARKVMGRGKGKVDPLLLEGASQGVEEAIDQLGPGPKLFPKRMLTIVVPDAMVELTVRTLIQINASGRPGDGKIFVTHVAEAARVRTGERGETAIDEMPSTPASAPAPETTKETDHDDARVTA